LREISKLIIAAQKDCAVSSHLCIVKRNRELKNGFSSFNFKSKKLTIIQVTWVSNPTSIGLFFFENHSSAKLGAFHFFAGDLN